MKRRGLYKRIFKRPLDLFFSLFALIALSPAMLLIAILVGYHLGRPVIFKQKRLGQDGRLFTLYKFRAKTEKKDESDVQLIDRNWHSKFGEFLRSSSLDALPEFFNVLKGDMSIVGPRPLLPRYLRYSHGDERLRQVVRPGMTGLSQVLGWNALTWDEWLQTDVHYVKTLSFRMDARIAIKTAVVALRGGNMNYATEPGVQDPEEEKRGEADPIRGEWEMGHSTVEERSLYEREEGPRTFPREESGNGFMVVGEHNGLRGYEKYGEEPHTSGQARSLD